MRGSTAASLDVAGADPETQPQARGDDGGKPALQIKGQSAGGNHIYQAVHAPRQENPFKTGGQDRLGFAGTGPGLEDQVFSLKDRLDGPNLKRKERRKGPVKGAEGVGELEEWRIQNYDRRSTCSWWAISS